MFLVLFGCQIVFHSDDDDDDGGGDDYGERTQEYPTISSMEEAARLVEVRLASRPGVNGLRLME